MFEHTESLFWPKVKKTRGCWLWTAATKGRGYGHFWDGEKNVSAHRFSWILHHGEIPAGMMVCHTCDTPACVRPSHLFLASNRENVLDSVRKGRWKRPQARA
jgi:HNH endonuclease